MTEPSSGARSVLAPDDSAVGTAALWLDIHTDSSLGGAPEALPPHSLPLSLTHTYRKITNSQRHTHTHIHTHTQFCLFFTRSLSLSLSHTHAHIHKQTLKHTEIRPITQHNTINYKPRVQLLLECVCECLYVYGCVCEGVRVSVSGNVGSEEHRS